MVMLGTTPEGDAYVRGGEWRTWETGLLLGHDLHGSTVGIVPSTSTLVTW